MEIFKKWMKWSLARKVVSVVVALFIVSAVTALVGCQEGTQEANQESQSAVETTEEEDVEEEAVETVEEETPEGTLTVHYIDVGQGDSEFIELPTGETMLIDAGTANEGKTVVSYIRALGYSSIDYLVATHPHSDHIGGMPAVFTAFDVGEVWASEVTHDTQTFENFLDAVDAKGLSINVATSGNQIASGNGMIIEILSPEDGASYSDLNDWSVIVLLTFGDESFLFTGDASASVISAASAGDIDVLKVGHHGSSTATTASLVKTLSPDYAVISCGANNSYGHPTDSALTALSSATVYRTDTDGTIIATSDGSSISWKTISTSTTEEASSSSSDSSSSSSSNKSSGSSSSSSSSSKSSSSSSSNSSSSSKNSGSSSSSSSGSSSPSSSDSSGSSSSSDTSSDTSVYITKTGTKYHLSGCSSLSKSKIETTLEKAKAQGYEPCKRCNPPS